MTKTGGETLREHRERIGISMEELAVDVSVSEGAVWQWEAGRTTPRRATALKVDQRLGAGGAVAEAFGYSTAPAEPVERNRTVEVSLLRAELEQERSERRSEVQELRDQVEELIDQMAAIAEAVDVLRQQPGAGQSSPRAATE